MNTAGTHEEVLVEAGTGRVRRGDAIIALPHRVAEIAVAVAVQPHPVPVPSLGALVYPDRGKSDAANMVKVCVYRLRRRIGRDFIVHHDGGYAVGPHVTVDLIEAQRRLRKPHHLGGPVLEPERLLRLARTLRAEPLAGMETWEWHEPVVRLAQRLGHDLAIHVAQAALEQSAYADAVAVARDLTYEDPCDEEAWGLLISAQLRLGKRAAALRGFRAYSAAAALELGAVPSAALRRLLESGTEANAVGF